MVVQPGKETSMIKVEQSVVINRPVADVFAYATNPANEPKWQDGVVEAGISLGNEMAVGAEITETRKFMGRDMVSRLTVTEYEPNKKFAGRVTEGPVPFEVTETFEEMDGGTKVTVHIEGEPGGFFKLAGGMVQKQLESQTAADFERLKKILEA
jgi:uncharacterized membrane protein